MSGRASIYDFWKKQVMMFFREIIKRVAEFKIPPTTLPLLVAATLLASDESIGGTRWCEVISSGPPINLPSSFPFLLFLYSSRDIQFKTFKTDECLECGKQGINRLFSTSDLTHETGACALRINGMSGIGKTTLARVCATVVTASLLEELSFGTEKHGSAGSSKESVTRTFFAIRHTNCRWDCTVVIIIIRLRHWLCMKCTVWLPKFTVISIL